MGTCTHADTEMSAAGYVLRVVHSQEYLVQKRSIPMGMNRVMLGTVAAVFHVSDSNSTKD